MALLTTDDVLNKKFQPTKFREGYDQDEVDDFLDEVVDTLRSLQDENLELKAKLEEAERRIAELTTSAPPVAAPAAVEPVVVEEVAPAPAPAPVPVPVVEEPRPISEPESATSMLALAQKLHDEYVRNGREEGERIITQAQEQAEQIVREGQEQHANILAQLDRERALLEAKIEELQVFEREYRARMRTFLESLLTDLSAGGSDTVPENL